MTMTPELKQSAVSSMTSIIRSIENDRQVYRWFLIITGLKEIREKLSLDQKTKDEYQNLQEIKTREIITYTVMGLIVIIAFLIKQPWPLLLEGVPLAALIYLFKHNRQSVALISEQFLLENVQSQNLKDQTLFQTCEYLSQRYNTPSLVDIITFQDFIRRKVLLGAIIFLPFIYPFNSWQIMIVMVIIITTTLAIVNTSLVLRKLK